MSIENKAALHVGLANIADYRHYVIVNGRGARRRHELDTACAELREVIMS